MKTESKIAELGMMNILSQLKNPLTNIRLCLEMLESGNSAEDPQVYYSIIKNSSLEIESSIQDICTTFRDLGMALHVEVPNNQE